MAQSQPPNIKAEQLQQLDELAQKALSATNIGDFATAETYWTEILSQFPITQLPGVTGAMQE